MTEFIRKRTANAKNDILSGLTVALALVPEAVSLLVANGHQVLLESNAGEGAHFTDNESVQT